MGGAGDPPRLVWWRASAILKFGKQMVYGLPQRCRTARAAIRARVDPHVDAVLAALDVAAVVSTVRGTFARRHVLAEARRHLLETLRGQEFTRGLDDYIASRALSDHSRQLTVPQPGRRTPAADQLTYTADFDGPGRWWIAGADGKPPRAATRYERARVASLAVQNAIRAARTAPAAGQDDAPAASASAAAHAEDHQHDQTSDAPHAVDHPGRDAALTPAQRAAAVHAHQQAAKAAGVPGGPHDRPGDVDAYTGEPGAARRLHPRGQRPPPRHRGPGGPGPGRRPGRPGRQAPPGARAAAPAARPRPRPGHPAVTAGDRPAGRTTKSPCQAPGRDWPPGPGTPGSGEGAGDCSP
ncbi:hypothetical protein [Streptomyces colonosanans]|uniref:hypothetical protein n=1 Tax=Streptomyces colonosanans TaxID=1428652 RepID=UPI000A60A73E|nr:hypothetical protein [Streptomyces colonosanans]